jgi:hypothetical protein
MLVLQITLASKLTLKKRRHKRERIHISISTHHSIARSLNVNTTSKLKASNKHTKKHTNNGFLVQVHIIAKSDMTSPSSTIYSCCPDKAMEKSELQPQWKNRSIRCKKASKQFQAS